MIHWNEHNTKEWFESQEGYKEYTFIEYAKRGNKNESHILISCGDNKHKPYWVRFSKLKSKRCKCRECTSPSITKERALKFIKRNAEGYEFISLYSINSIKFIEYKCPNNHIYSTNYLSFERGCRCGKCIGWSERDILNLFESKGFELINFKKEKSYNAKYLAKDSKGYLYYANLDIVKYSNPNWIRGNPYAIHNIRLWIKLNRPDYELISKSFKYVLDKVELKYIGNLKILKKDSDRLFSMALYAFLNGERPAIFKISKQEQLLVNFFNSKGIIYEREYTFESCIDKKKLRFDFAIFDNKNDLSFLIEVQGKQHYEYTDFFHKNYYSFMSQLNRDFKKLSYCLDNNIKLLKIKYDTFDNSLKKLRRITKNDL